MRTTQPHEFAAVMLSLAPQVVFAETLSAGPRPFSFAVWLGRLYGYVYNESHTPVVERIRKPTLVGCELAFTRNDEPGARRRAEWLRNPNMDPQLTPPVSWHFNGGPGFCPPGWHPAARLVITPEVEASLRYEDEQFVRRLNLPWTSRLSGMGRPPLQPLPPPPPPPASVAYPDERGSRP